MEVLGVSVKAYFIQYRFILPENIKHSSYTYQKLFRAIYGYTQAVYKASGKKYHYHREGILSNVPFIRPGKNCVVIPQNAFQNLQDFFKTGNNPTHNWVVKGDWKCTYFLNEKDILEKDAVKAIEDLLSRKYITGVDGLVKLSSELERIANSFENVNPNYKLIIYNESEKMINNVWFKEVYSSSNELNKFYQNFKKLK
jgi:hypothetical protein